MKIHIIGESGSGKTTVAKQLVSQHNIPLLELDDIFWDNNVKGYGQKRDKEERHKLLKDFMQNSNYIIEGIYFSWLYESFENADKIYVLDVNIHIRNFRILKRFLLRKLGVLASKGETFKSIINLIKWNFENLKKGKENINTLKEKYFNKVIILKNDKDINKVIGAK